MTSPWTPTLIQQTMMPSGEHLYLRTMRSIEAASSSLGTLSWIWGGFTIDIYENRMLREHSDIDYLTLDLHGLIPKFLESFTACGWEGLVLENDDLRLKRDGIKVHLGHVELRDKARWTHNGEKGSIWFPSDWLRSKPVIFCGVELHVVRPEFQYALLERPEMLNPDWQQREKDLWARRFLASLLEKEGIRPQAVLKRISETKP